MKKRDKPLAISKKIHIILVILTTIVFTYVILRENRAHPKLKWMNTPLKFGLILLVCTILISSLTLLLKWFTGKCKITKSKYLWVWLLIVIIIAIFLEFILKSVGKN